MNGAAPCSLGHESGIITGFASQRLNGFVGFAWMKSQSPHPGALG